MLKNSVYITTFKSFTIKYQDLVISNEEIKSDKIIKTLAYLLIPEQKKLLTSDLIDLIWGNDEIKNPLNALKNLIYRLRGILKRELKLDNFILTGENSYFINNEYILSIDTIEFETTLEKMKSDVHNLPLYEKIQKLYKGSYLSEINEDYRLLSKATYYHSKFISCMTEYALLLEKDKNYIKMDEVIRYAITLDHLDEKLHAILIKSLYLQGHYQEAINMYKDTTDLLYKTLAVEPSQEMKKLYEVIKKQDHENASNFFDIQNDLVAQERQGAYFCEYGTFRDLYNFEARMQERLGICTHLCLLTVQDTSKFNSTEDRKTFINKTMQKTQIALVGGLRAGDVITRFSTNQFLVLLSICNHEDSQRTMDRVLKNIHKSLNNKKIFISLSINELKSNLLEQIYD